MADTPSRMFGLVGVLILLWVVVYWLYEPRSAARPAPPVTLDAGPPPTPPVSETVTALPPPPDPPPPAITTPAEPVAAKPRARVVPPEFRSYRVQRGDVSFEAIAQRLFGDRRKWEIIARANPFVTSDRLKPGRTVLNIPVDPDNIQGRVVVEGGDAAADQPPQETTYIVQRDDTLWGIARKVYQRGSAWRMIYEANRDVIKDPDRPPAGAVLRIPPRPAE